MEPLVARCERLEVPDDVCMLVSLVWTGKGGKGGSGDISSCLFAVVV